MALENTAGCDSDLTEYPILSFPFSSVNNPCYPFPVLDCFSVSAGESLIRQTAFHTTFLFLDYRLELAYYLRGFHGKPSFAMEKPSNGL